MSLNGLELPSPWGSLWLHKLASADSEQSHAPLICLHPAPFDGGYFAGFGDYFEGQRDVWAPDYPGYGRSDPPDQAPSIGDYAEGILHATARQFAAEPGQQTHLLGFHTGCLLACEMGIQAPDRIGCLILVDLPYFTGDEQQQKYRENYDGSPASQAFGASFSYPCAERLSQVKKRTLVIASNSALSNPTTEAAGVIPDAQLEKLPDVSRPVFKSGGKRIAALVSSFLRT